MSAIKKKSTRKKKVSQKEEMEKLVALLQDWQKLEARGIKFLNALQKETENKVINEVLEIIKCDSRQHRRVQQFLIDGLTKEAYSLAVEEVSDIADKLAEHDKLEEEAIEFAKRARKNTSSSVMRFFLSYLLEDEEKHHKMLDNLDDVKRNLYPYGW
jgi:hypothetical protein